MGVMSGMGYWFVSHCSRDIKIVEQVVAILKDCGIPYWKAPEMIPAGSNYAKEIPKALKNCNVFLLLVSESAQNSVWIEKELDSAVNARKKIIPVRIDDVQLNDMYTFYMNNVQMIDIQIQDNGEISKQSREVLYTKFKESVPQKNIKINTGQEIKKTDLSVVMTENKSIIRATAAQKEIERNRLDARANAFRINKIPIFCKQCDGKLEHVEVGTYRCPVCNIDYYDDFKKIRNYIRDNGPMPAIMIARNTGVSKQTIEYYFSDDAKLEPQEIDYVPNHVTKKENTKDKDYESKWRSNVWKR